jgi:lipoprotein-anchoring transpeptidase ErfK/SrfK
VRRTKTAGFAALALAAVLALTGCASARSGAGTAASSSVAATGRATTVRPKPVPTTPAPAHSTPKPVPAKKVVPDMCATNTRAQFVLVVVAQQHAYMCAGSKQVYDSPVTTGATVNGDDTPLGTWPVQGKQQSRYLTTRDGSSYHVNFWMPYDGDYGFHDATWQTFPEGTQQYHADGSHGCVHLPMPAMTWLYNWAQVGATVTVAA